MLLLLSAAYAINPLVLAVSPDAFDLAQAYIDQIPLTFEVDRLEQPYECWDAVGIEI